MSRDLQKEKQVTCWSPGTSKHHSRGRSWVRKSKTQWKCPSPALWVALWVRMSVTVVS